MTAHSPSRQQDPEGARQAREAGLRHVSDAMPGYSRHRRGRGFAYRDPEGRIVRDPALLARFKALAIPPAYTDVWISRFANGHLQATGRDARGRKQYRYHPDWQQASGEGKFERIVAFGRALPRLRRHVRKDLGERGWPKRKVLALAVAVMAETLLRVGNEAYRRENGSFGLTTLRNRHVGFLKGGRVQFRFKGKSGLRHEAALDDARLARQLRLVQQLPGQWLFQYRDDEGDVVPVDSGDINDYLHDAMGEAFTAKDFRTWGATLAAFQRLATTPLPEGRDGAAPSERALKAVETAVLSEVAGLLGNTPAVCRRAYVDPTVWAGWRDGRVHRAAARGGANGARGARQWELAALAFLKRARRD
ncbi:DNA topoisomerase IB [Marilutibacter aestuarii]|uniref:DNA topoisomerase n=1 Tax=Marilutibacter aestuarii TaxID=1706195 RepID=A0A508A158_9GAMM|nr:DNA topoisomerase IB [Lysobacter aestuarii]TQD43027.1 DNA topoisomerase IB [Lysobacter aestuarii]